MGGGFVAQAPNALLTQHIGWRGVEWIYFGAQLLALIGLVLLWVAEYCHDKRQPAKPRHAGGDESLPTANTANQSPLENGDNPSEISAHPTPSGSAEMAIVTPYEKKPGHVKVLNGEFSCMRSTLRNIRPHPRLSPMPHPLVSIAASSITTDNNLL